MYSPPALTQSMLVKTLIAKGFSGYDKDEIQKGFYFMSHHSEKEQWELCRKRISEAKESITNIINEEKWPCFFPEGNQMWFNIEKPNMRCNRISIGIAPDTYLSVFMETALLRKNTLDFLDDYGYENQEPNNWSSLNELTLELRRIVKIYEEI